MGRRALPKIRPDVDLSKHLFPLEDANAPFEPAAYFPNPTWPLHLEIGTGKGLFLQTMAEAKPNENFVGIEMARKYAKFAAYRLARQGSLNAIVFQGDGLRFFADFVSDASVDSVHVYFPDPWWKDRHRKRRVMKESLIRDVQRVLKIGGQLHFWTDVQEYYETTLDLIAKVSKLDGPHPVEEKSAKHTLDYQTHFERRTRMHNKPVYRSLYSRID